MKKLTVKNLEELQTLLKGMNEIYEAVRIIDPVNTIVLHVENNELVKSEQCFDIWNRESKCVNCISGRCILRQERIEKLETNGEMPYFMISLPLVIEDYKYDNPLSLEIITKAKELENDYDDVELMPFRIQQLNQKVFFDSLTGIYNRRFFDEKVLLLSRMVIKQNPVVLVMTDLYKFKSINDECGHTFGDYVLKSVASVVNNNLDEGDFAIRYGGDEFVIIMQNISLEVATEKVNKIKNKVNEFFLNDCNKDIRINAGLAYCDELTTSNDVVELFNMADHNMYIDKMNTK